jgi:hypothetical protein
VPLVSIESHTNPVHTLLSCIFTLYFNIARPSVCTLSKQSPSFRVSYQNPVCIFLLPCVPHAPPSSSSFSWSVDYKSWSPSLCNFLHRAVTCSILGLDIPQHFGFESLSLCWSHSARDQVSHPYKTTGKITVFHVPVLTFSHKDTKW